MKIDVTMDRRPMPGDPFFGRPESRLPVVMMMGSRHGHSIKQHFEVSWADPTEPGEGAWAAYGAPRILEPGYRPICQLPFYPRLTRPPLALGNGMIKHWFEIEAPAVLRLKTYVEEGGRWLNAQRLVRLHPLAPLCMIIAEAVLPLPDEPYEPVPEEAEHGWLQGQFQVLDDDGAEDKYTLAGFDQRLLMPCSPWSVERSVDPPLRTPSGRLRRALRFDD